MDGQLPNDCHGLRTQAGVEDDWVLIRCSCGETLKYPRCAALKRDRSRCPAYQVVDSMYCRQHQPRED
jgi:hypothetical protein